MSSPSDPGASSLDRGDGGVERRRFPRVPPGPGVSVSMPHVIDAEVIDLSGSGALVSAASALKPGHRAQLRMLLAREPFSTWVEVIRAEQGTMVGKDFRCRVGVRFTTLEASSRRTLQRFVHEDGRIG